MNIEAWKPINGYGGLYSISNHGRVKSEQRFVNNNSGQRIVHEKIKKLTYKDERYMSVGLWKNNKNKNFYVHRLVAKSFIPNPEKYLEVNHKDLNRRNNHMNNLEWCNRQMNHEHAVKNNVYDGINRKLTYKQIDEIRKNHPMINIYKQTPWNKYGITKSTYYRILKEDYI